MSITYDRACYYVAPDGQSDLLLAIDEAGVMNDEQLIDEAMLIADETGMIGSDEHQVSRAKCRAHLHIGEYSA